MSCPLSFYCPNLFSASYAYEVLRRIFLYSSSLPNLNTGKTINGDVFDMLVIVQIGRAITQEVSRRLPTVAARVRAQVRSCGICGGQSGTGASFLRVLRFPLSILIPPTAPHSSFITRGWYNGPISGRRTKWTESHPTPRRNYCSDCEVMRSYF
jgi:hypothetical protein